MRHLQLSTGPKAGLRGAPNGQRRGERRNGRTAMWDLLANGIRGKGGSTPGDGDRGNRRFRALVWLLAIVLQILFWIVVWKYVVRPLLGW